MIKIINIIKQALCLIWLAMVVAETQPVIPADKTPMSDLTTKVKRNLIHGITHGPSSPCPPFYPHFHEPQPPMYLTKPYGPPAYRKPVYASPIMSHNHHAQYIHQPSYSSYVPKQTISYVKPQVSKPLYNYLPAKSIIHQAQPIQQLIKHQAQWQYPQVNYHQKPQYAYAPAYHKPMIQHESYIKPVNYHAALASSNVIQKPGIVYKSDIVNCAPCHHQPVQHQAIHVQPSYIKPIIHQAPVHPAPVYLPTQLHVQPTIIKPIGHGVPCAKK